MAQGDIDTLLHIVRERLEDVTDQVVTCFRGEIPAYATVPDPDLRPGVRSNIERALQALQRGWEPTSEEIVAARSLGEHRAQQGLPIDALLQAHRIGVREAIALVRMEGEGRGVPAEALLELATRAWAWADAVMLAAATGHRDRELDLVGQEQQQRAHLLRGLLHGGLEESGLQVGAASYGIALHDTYVPMLAEGPAAALHRLERCLAEAARALDAAVLIGHLDSGLAGVVGPPSGGARHREVIDQAAAAAGDEVMIAVGIGASLRELGPGYRLTQQTLEAARSLGHTGLVELRDFALHAGVLAQSEISELFERRHLAPLDAEGDFGAEMLATLESWYDHGMRTEETAAALFVHPNTLRHRLRRAEDLTGLSLQRTTDRFELWWALTWRQLQRRSTP
jgi:hypothetical protein